ncbi:response regulator transcription factor [Ginsengibacter hankyongi]|uniref:Response regulator transcription factor n=1 Tax=Ginsengibacter hankyongi TaxID=2607284 RepID=A0A5J5ICQ0_9BACT|nr:response regulator transcription factor [Ginsengibacter hankyongi]KAA9037255.1 response regulator transcription factor [Ginsengibacter hankyongi]
MIFNLIIAHSHPVIMAILHNVLRSYRGVQIISKITTASALLKAAIALSPDIIIADIGLAERKEFTALQKLAIRTRSFKIILLWQQQDQHKVAKAIAAGCIACIKQDASPTAIILAVKMAMKGQAFYCSQTELAMTAGNNRPGTSNNNNRMLNEKFIIVLYCSRMGWSIKEIAVAANLSKETVYTYRKRLKKMLGSLNAATIDDFMRKNGLNFL